MLKTWCRLCLDFQLLTQWARIEVRVWLHLQRDIKKSSQRSCRYFLLYKLHKLEGVAY